MLKTLQRLPRLARLAPRTLCMKLMVTHVESEKHISLVAAFVLALISAYRCAPSDEDAACSTNPPLPVSSATHLLNSNLASGSILGPPNNQGKNGRASGKWRGGGSSDGGNRNDSGVTREHQRSQSHTPRGLRQ